ncbi:MAG: RNA polymerase sigma factor [Bacteroidetes bacterium]|nr:RNA polymerase sigma factor [Bacteroidota bacterium]
MRRSLDSSTISAFIAGDVKAFKEVYEFYADSLFAYCLYIMGDTRAAEDALQEVLIRIYSNREQLREGAAIKSWLMKITRSVCLNLTRTSKFTPEFVYLDADFEDEEGILHRQKELSFEAIDPAMPQQIFQYAFERVAPIYREAFLLKEVEGFSYAEIADLTGVSVPNVKVRINRAKKMLRKLLAPHFRAELGSRIPSVPEEHEQ